MKSKITSLIIKGILILIGLSCVFPLFWMLTMSFKSRDEVYNNPFGLPQHWVFTNYGEALKKFHFFTYFLNSLIYTVGTVLITLLLGSMFAYCVSRMEWKYKNLALSYCSLGLIVPVQVVIIPIFIILKQIGIKNTYLGLILPYSAFALSSCILMLYAFFRGLPKELEEAACIDGCNIYQCYFKIILPIVKPALTTQCVLIFMNTWNEFFLSFILVGKEQLKTLSVGLLNFFVSIGVSHWGQIGAAMIISSLPTVLVYLFSNEQIENALTAGAILK
jgi:raffinose/stachyose/melibiose transport system permease protein